VIPILETPRLLMRGFRQSDIDEYAAICADVEVTKYLSSPPMSREEAWRHMAMILGHWELRGYGMWAVEEKATGHLLGRIGLLNPEDWPGLELGWILGRQHWHRGFATEGARAALEYAFSTLGAERIISLIRKENLPSTRVAEHIGERFEREVPFKGTDVLMFAISRPRPDSQK
jgi:RimJ/RimL family protein N-acetyltransferase